ncbi:protein of unknown function [Spirosomataceae bacterium TFI 002]|nr:protein of unknown function [Spirosomataceae bacterium TFI 002]
MKKILFAVLFICFSLLVKGQNVQLSEQTQVSLLTISAGEELYSTFGHSAIRINDPINGIDENYNYGSFDFDAEGFYIKFLRGTLPYEISSYEFSREFQYWTSLEYQGRGVIQQVLNLNQEQKQKVYELLEENLKPENKQYQYKFFFDNCSTRLKDILQSACGDSLSFNPSIHPDSTYRQWIDKYAKENNKLWSDFAMDIAIGVPSDDTTGWEGAMFLPYNLMDAFGGAQIIRNGKSEPFVIIETVLAERRITNPEERLTPIIFFGIIFALALYITWIEVKSEVRSKWFDKTFFTITGVSGLIFCLLWFATDHGVTNQNFNILWAFPLVLFAVWKKNKTSKVIFLIQMILALFLILAWWYIPQGLNPAIIPIAGIVIIRSYLFWKRN